MNNIVAIVLIGITLMFTASASYSEPVDYTFAATGPRPGSDPLLTGLSSVTGSFTYENGAPPFGTISDGISTAGSTIHVTLSNLSGNANGNIFGDPQGISIVGNDKFSNNVSPLRDIFLMFWDPTGFEDLAGFSFNGLDLVNVRFFWLEGQNGIGDFLEDQSLPSVLPPTIAGRLALDFTDSAGVRHFTFFDVTVVPVIPPDSDINFTAELAIVEVDDGNALYSGVPVGSEFFGSINRLTSEGFVSDGTTYTPFSCCSGSGRGLDVFNDSVLDAEGAAILTNLTGTDFVAGDLIDGIEIAGDAVLPAGDRIEVGLVYVLNPLAFDDESRNNYPPDPMDVLVQIFFIVQEGPGDDEVSYLIAGTFTVDEDGDADGIQDAIDGTFRGGFNDQSDVFSSDFTDQNLGGATSGSIVDRSDLIVKVTDVPVSGVMLTAINGTGTAQIRTCTNPVANIFLSDGARFIATCGSFIGEPLVGLAVVTLGINISLTIPVGAIALLEELPGSTVLVTNIGGTDSGDILIDDGSTISNLGPGDPPAVVTVQEPDNKSKKSKKSGKSDKSKKSKKSGKSGKSDKSKKSDKSDKSKKSGKSDKSKKSGKSDKSKKSGKSGKS